MPLLLWHLMLSALAGLLLCSSPDPSRALSSGADDRRPSPPAASGPRRPGPGGPPWPFEASRIRYRFLSVPADAARRSIAFSGPDGAEEGDDRLRLLSFAGKTLGGIFAIEYTASPVGPYREVAVLAGLVTESVRTPMGDVPNPLLVGAWASHIFVDVPAAAECGERFWGLPATVVDEIDFDVPMPDVNERSGGAITACAEFMFAADGIRVSVAGWAGDAASSSRRSILPAPAVDAPAGITLPSYSGRLRPGEPLLRYPLTISNVGKFSLAGTTPTRPPPAVETKATGDAEDEGALRSFLKEARPLLSVDVSRATLVAGVPEEL